MSENTRDWHVTLTTRAYLSYTVEADDEESAIEMATHEFKTQEDGGFYDLTLGEKVSTTDAYILGMY